VGRSPVTYLKAYGERSSKQVCRVAQIGAAFVLAGIGVLGIIMAAQNNCLVTKIKLKAFLFNTITSLSPKHYNPN
jgi:hypothetical protein